MAKCLVEGCPLEVVAELAVNGNVSGICEDHLTTLVETLAANPSCVVGMRIEGDDENGDPLTLVAGEMDEL